MDDRITEIREVAGGQPNMSGLNDESVIWWCLVHRYPARSYAPVRRCLFAMSVKSATACDLVKRLLVDSDALIIRRDANGEWPEAVIGRLVGPSPNRRHRMRSVLDALASSQGVEP